MLVRNFPSAFVLGVIVVASIVVFWSFTYGTTRSIQLVPQLLHGNPEAASDPPSSPHHEASKPTDRPKVHDVHFEWESRVEAFPVATESLFPLPTGAPSSIPPIQHVFEPSTNEDYNNQIRDRRNVIRDAMARCWKGYKTFAWLKDELAVVSAQGSDSFGGWAATLIGSLDTLWIMDMIPEFEEAVEALKEIDFTFSAETEINTVETTLRYLGALLATHDLTEGKYEIVLQKAVDLGNMLYASFDTPNRMPITRWEWRKVRDGDRQETSDKILLAEMGSLSLEFTRLSQITGDPKYYDAIQRVLDSFESWQKTTRLPGLWPAAEDPKDKEASERDFTLSLDATYQYLPKQYMLLGGQSEQPRKMYEQAVEVAKDHLFYRPMTKEKKDVLLSGLVHAKSSTKAILDAEGQHAACYTGGMIGIGSQIFDRKDDLTTARKLLDGCLWAYDASPIGIMPEKFHTVPCPNKDECEWDNQAWLDDVLKRHTPQGVDQENLDWKILEYRINPGFADIPDRRFTLRPEVIESVFILYRITGDEELRDRAWQLFDTIEKITKIRFGNSAVDDVTTYPYPEHADSMESFWMATTLKYFYLCFVDQTVLNLDEWVFNAAGHPFRRPKVASEEKQGGSPEGGSTGPEGTEGTEGTEAKPGGGGGL